MTCGAIARPGQQWSLAWSVVIVLTLQARAQCPGTGNCCAAQASAGCDDRACCESICANDPLCCTAEWDDLCAAQAQTFCAVCGADCQPACDLQNVECLDDSGLMNEFSNRRFVAQLRRADGAGYCTAWIIGAPDCLITAAHCQVAAGDTAVFDFECNACTGGALKVTTTFTVTQVLASNVSFDWTLFRVSGNAASQFGLASVDPTGVAVGQPVYGIHHAGEAVKAYDDGTVTALNQDPPECGGSVPVHAISVVAAVEAHGAPVLRTDNHCVAGMYACGASCGDGFFVPMSATWPAIQTAILQAGCTAQLCGEEPRCPRADHNCFTIGVPGCTDTDCCSDVCVIDDFCCEVMWDQVCIGEATQLCPGCGNPGAGDCGEPHVLPFCSDAACCAIVCAADPFCCNSAWDSQCVEEAGQLCNALACGSKNAGSCFVAHIDPYCNNGSCCQTVCAADPFCCDVVWDVVCATEAAELCCPADLSPLRGPDVCGDGDGTVGPADLAELLATWGPCAACCADLAPPGSPDGTVGAADLAQLLAGWGPCR